MQIINPFDPTAASSGTIQVALVNRCAVIYLINESPVGLKLTFADGHTGILPPWYARAYKLPKPGAIQWSQQYTLAPGAAPLSVVQGEGYEPSEVDRLQLAQGPLSRQTNIGNSIPVSTNTTSIANDGNAAGTSIVEATVSGDTASAVTLTNDAVMSLGSTAHPGSLTMKGPLTSTSTVSLDSGNITTDGAGNLVTTSVQFNEHAAPRVKISGDASGNMNFDIPNGTRLAQLTSTGLTVSGSLSAGAISASSLSSSGNISSSANISASNGLTITGGKVQLIVGTITKMTFISGTGNGSVNTNSGANPTTLAFNPCTVSGSTQTIGGTNTQTTTVTTGAGLAWSALCYTQ